MDEATNMSDTLCGLGMLEAARAYPSHAVLKNNGLRAAVARGYYRDALKDGPRLCENEAKNSGKGKRDFFDPISHGQTF